MIYFRFPLLVIMLGAFLSLSPLNTARSAELTAGQQSEVKALIRDYLIKNPEIIQEALNELEKRQADQEKANQSKALSEWLPVILKSGRSTVLGNPKGDVTLIEFFDYNCGYCKKALTDLQGRTELCARLHDERRVDDALLADDGAQGVGKGGH